jgi:SAM-dependent methyltransferase
MTVDYDRTQADRYDADYAALRDGSGDRAFYRNLALATGGDVLEIGCGTGRVLLPIAAAGVPCVGVDPSSEMLRVLRAKSPPANLSLVSGSATTFDLSPRRFGFVFSAFRVFQHLLTIDEQLAALANVRRHLAPGGRFAFDLFAPDLARIAGASEPETEDVRTHDGADEYRRIVWVERDHGNQVMRVFFRHERWRDGKKQDEAVVEHAMRWFFRFEVEHLLARAGFAIESLYGGFDGRPFDGNGEIIVVAQPTS